jgi:predicted nucleotidyltransferase
MIKLLIMHLDEQKQKQIIEILKPYGLSKLSLFGSYARGEATSMSDIDLIGEFRRSNRTSLIDLVRMERTIRDQIGIKADILTRSGVSPHVLPHIEKDELVIFNG